ncbi:MAG TPA: U32 family peptidase [Prolixibacteraceae bacterium]|nr:U32 family peptidase [Prolixibacteraceae bacterium]
MNINQSNFKPELLVPVGSIETFFAAIDGGANAIYLGLNDFNARKRANNFTPWQLAALVKTARKKSIKVYVTLNTVIRNSEIIRLLNTLFVLSQIKPDALIVQDWGVYFLARKIYPQLKLHASTQMANHNSAGVNFSAKMGFERVVLARELTKSELETIARKKQTQLEMFVHGALCYSFSGMCLFSSYLGGASANRGMCTQPCRRLYGNKKNKKYLFSLKDNQLIDHLPFISKIKIDSLKIEGRLKNAEYVYQATSRYRKTIDQLLNGKATNTEPLLDFGREKTDYFLGRNISNAITQSAGTGFYIGKVTEASSDNIEINTNTLLKKAYRIRFRNAKTDFQSDFKIESLVKTKNGYNLQAKGLKIQTNDEVYLIGRDLKFPSKIDTQGIKINERLPENKLKSLAAIATNRNKATGKTTLFVRIDQLKWLENIDRGKFKGIIINLSKKALKEIDLKQNTLQKNKAQIWFELPKFIPESSASFYRQMCQKMLNSGFNKFSVSHLSQKELLPAKASFITNENVYTFNDAACKLIKEQGAENFIFPYENDIVNLSKSTFRSGWVPIYFYPPLFFSRMPIEAKKDSPFSDQNGTAFRKLIRDGITIVLPEQAVSLSRFKNKLDRYGFYNYFIDLSFVEPNKKTVDTIVNKFYVSEGIQPSNIFNFKREMK